MGSAVGAGSARARSPEPAPAGWHGGAARPVCAEPPPSSAYVPKRGDVVSINLSATGSAKSGRRTAVVLSLAQQGAALCPITNRVKGVRSGVAIPKGSDVAGVILADRIKTVDWRARNAELITRLPEETVAAVMQKLDDLERRLCRAWKLYELRNSGVPAAAAWRAVNPGTPVKDRSAAEQTRREIRWCHEQLERLHGKRCGGVAGRPCEKRVASARHTYCAACAAERLSLRRQGYNRKYYRDHREKLSEDRAGAVAKYSERELAEFLTAFRRVMAPVMAKVQAKRDYDEAVAAQERREEGPPEMDENLTMFFNRETRRWEYKEQGPQEVRRLAGA